MSYQHDSAPKPDSTPIATNANTDASGPTPRYNSTDEMRAEFGSYRVNQKTDNLCDSAAPYPIEPVFNDPLTEEQNNDSARSIKASDY